MVTKKKITKQKQATSKEAVKKASPEATVKNVYTGKEKTKADSEEKVIKISKDDKKEAKNEKKAKETASNDKVLELEDIIKQKDEEIESLKKEALYDKAETDNLRKRMFKEKSELRTHLYRDVVSRILPVVDNLERAVSHVENSTKEVLQEGVEMTLVLFKDVFGGLTIKQFDSIGKPFDPEFHEAMSREIKEDVEEGTITQEFVKGYMIGDKLLRPAQVVVSYKDNADKEDAGKDITEESNTDSTTHKES